LNDLTDGMNLMKNLIAQFPSQLRAAIEIGKNAVLSLPEKEIKNVVVSGLGGSGIGGNLVNELTAHQMRIPFIVNKDYHLPAFVNEHSLVIISSYSGNTEETLNALEMALAKKARIVVISSGGQAIEKAKENRLNHIVIPGGHPPRSCLGYSAVQQMYVLNKLGIIGNNFEKELLQTIDLLTTEQPDLIEKAKKIARQLYDKIPVIYASSEYESVAIRFRQQINENSKMLCWHHVVPEMNHNELVGWRKASEALAVVFIRNHDDFHRTQLRMEINKKLIARYTNHIFEIWSKGASKTEKAFYLIHLTDWVSLFLAELNNVDVVEVNVIDQLKKELAKN
jgi:glucose/mannose-6-phosphate isomerase